MKRTSADGSVSSLYVDYDASTSTDGTLIAAEDLNMHQEELCNAVTGAGFTLDSADKSQLLKAIISLSHGVGELLFSAIKKSPSTLWPAVSLDADTVLSATNYPDLVPALRAEKITVASTSSFTGTVSGSVITFTSVAALNAILAALVEDSQVHGGDAETSSFSAWRCINIGGTDYAISAISSTLRTVTVSGSPATGSQTAIFYPYRIVGSATTARIYKGTGRALMAHDDSEKFHIAGLRRRDYGQQLTGSLNSAVGSEFYSPTGVFTSPTGACTRRNGGDAQTNIPILYFDSANSPGARTSTRTAPRSLNAHLYMWAGRYVA